MTHAVAQRVAEQQVGSVLVAAASIGAASETWIRRQLRGFEQLRPVVLTWRVREHGLDGLSGIPVHQLDTDPEPFAGNARWLLRLRHVPDGNFFGSVGEDRRQIERCFSRERPSVVLCHFGHTALRVLPVALSMGIPVVAHFHGMDLSSMLNNRWYRWSLARWHTRFAASIVVGHHQVERLGSMGADLRRVHVIPCGVPVDTFTPATPDDPEAPPNGCTRFVVVSRLLASKGIREAIVALSELVRDGIDARLTIVGDGPERGALEELAASLRLGAAVRFLGAQREDAVRRELRDADVFLQHSLPGANGSVEGFGVSIAEASAMELPVVVTRLGGIPDQVVDGETGFLVEPNDVRAMADAMRRLAADRALRRRLGRAGRKRMVEHFDTRLQIDKLEQVLIRAMGAGRPDAPGVRPG